MNSHNRLLWEVDAQILKLVCLNVKDTLMATIWDQCAGSPLDGPARRIAILIDDMLVLIYESL